MLDQKERQVCDGSSSLILRGPCLYGPWQSGTVGQKYYLRVCGTLVCPAFSSKRVAYDGTREW